MFNITQINELSKKVKSGADFPQLVEDLKSIGVTQYDAFVSIGQTTYYGANNFVLNTEPKYAAMPVNSISSATKLKQALVIHQNGETDYLTFCKQALDAGVTKWTTHLLEMTVTYFDNNCNALIIESIPNKN